MAIVFGRLVNNFNSVDEISSVQLTKIVNVNVCVATLLTRYPASLTEHLGYILYTFSLRSLSLVLHAQDEKHDFNSKTSSRTFTPYYFP